MLRWAHNQPSIELIYRFPNAPRGRDGHFQWDIHQLFAGVEHGLRRCAEIATEAIASIAVDGWAVDYVRLDESGQPISDPFCYRDPRTIRVESRVHARIRPEALFSRTGIQPLRINTLYQLIADRDSGTGTSAPWVCLPEFILMRLGGSRVAEYTNATHTGLVNPETRDWEWDLFKLLDLDRDTVPPLVPPGSVVGNVRGDLATLPAFSDTALIAPACHDTASAVSAIPAISGDSAYISSGTWSLVGTLTGTPCLSKEAYESGFTNLGALGGRFCFHKNVTGMWLLKQCIDHWQHQGTDWHITKLITAAEVITTDVGRVDVDVADLMLPGDMPSRLNEQLKQRGFSAIPDDPSSAPLFANLIFRSLSARYAEVIESLEELRNRRIERIYIVGGGSRNFLLNRLTREATGKEVICGEVESSTIGNFAVQLASAEGRFHPRIGVSAEAVIEWAQHLV
jgi:rhamnulokinase